ncbi:MAG: hypothetical protein WBJ21_02885 [Burkholderiaceae bacterium]
MDQATMMKYGIAAGIIFAAYKYGNGMVKGAALAIAGVAVAKRIPYVNEVI